MLLILLTKGEQEFVARASLYRFYSGIPYYHDDNIAKWCSEGYEGYTPERVQALRDWEEKFFSKQDPEMMVSK